MPQQKTQWVTAIFGGGWATDFGPTVRAAPINGVLTLPFLADARNVMYELNGGVHKMPGTVKLNSTAMESGAAVMGVYDYWRQGTSANPQQRRVCHVGTTIQADNADGVFANIGTGLVSGAIPHHSTFDDLLIIASDAPADVPRSWDQSTFQTLAGSPPRFSFSAPHKNRQWAAGNFAAPSRLYYSVNNNPEDWTGSGSGSIDIDPDDGDLITAIYSFKDELWVFKGPYKGSIHRITGADPSTFARKVFIRGIGASWIHGVFPLPNDLGFLSPRGTVHSLVATEQFGDYERATLSFPINRTLQADLNHARYRYWRAATDLDAGYVLLAISPSGQTNNTKLLHMDFRFLQLGEPYPRWALWDTYGAASLATVIDTGTRNRIFAGLYDGHIYKLEQTDRTHNSSAINMHVETPFLTYGAEHAEKTLYVVGLDIAPKNGQTMTFKWLRDGQVQQTATVTQGGSDVLGTWTSNQFTLDTSTLGGSRYLQRYIELETGGTFRSVRYTVQENNNNSDCELHALTTAITYDGVSTENA